MIHFDIELAKREANQKHFQFPGLIWVWIGVTLFALSALQILFADSVAKFVSG